MMTFRNLASGRKPRRGAALLEFALVSLAFYLLVAGAISIGRWVYTLQSAQDVVRVAAREIALYPMPAEFTFDQALADPGFRQAVYDPGFLVLDLEANPPGAALDAFIAGLPVVNRALVPLMITSFVDVEGTRRQLLHMPGLLTNSADSPTGLTVVIPRIDARDPDTGAETDITLLPVLEEFGPGSFSWDSPDRGLVV
ncbi:MAG: TadE family protein, partial [Planctomycetota bacterium]